LATSEYIIERVIGTPVFLSSTMLRKLFPADYIIWVDTIKKGRFEDTNQMFVKPENFDFHVTTQDAKIWAPKIFEGLK